MKRSGIPDHPGRCCDAVIRVLEGSHGTRRRDVRLPEREGHSAPVGVVCIVGEQRYAIAHTRIEARPDRLQDGVGFSNDLQAVQEGLNGRLPLDSWFQLTVSAGAFHGVSTADIPRIRQRVSDWAYRTAWTMERNPRGYVSETVEAVDDMPFQIFMITWRGDTVWVVKLFEAGAFASHDEMLARRHEIPVGNLVDLFSLP